jgi:hypothetical protein
VVSTTPWPLYPRERPGTHCTGGWVGPRAGLDLSEKSHPHRDSIHGPSSLWSVAVPTELPGPPYSVRYDLQCHNVMQMVTDRFQHYQTHRVIRHMRCKFQSDYIHSTMPRLAISFIIITVVISNIHSVRYCTIVLYSP